MYKICIVYLVSPREHTHTKAAMKNKPIPKYASLSMKSVKGLPTGSAMSSKMLNNLIFSETLLLLKVSVEKKCHYYLQSRLS